MRASTETLYCSFCGKSQHERFLLCGVTGHICDECVDLAKTVVDERRCRFDPWFDPNHPINQPSKFKGKG